MCTTPQILTKLARLYELSKIQLREWGSANDNTFMLASCYNILYVFFNLDFIVIFIFFAMSRSSESRSEILTVEMYYKSHSNMD